MEEFPEFNLPYLTKLKCAANQFKKIPLFPVTLEELDFSHNWLTVLEEDAFPPGLKTLQIINIIDEDIISDEGINFLKSFLPKGLKELDCSICSLKSLSPPSLRILQCANNCLSSIDNLPIGMQYLNCSQNQIVSLPIHLPLGLISLNVSHNMLETIPPLPLKLNVLNCSYNNISKLCFPNDSNLRVLDCGRNLLVEVPALPETIHDVTLVGNKITFIDTTKLPSSLNHLSICLEKKQKDKYQWDKKIQRKDFEKEVNAFNRINMITKCKWFTSIIKKKLI